MASGVLALSLCGAQTACHRSADPERLTAAGLLRRSVDSLQHALDRTDTLTLARMEDLFATERGRLEARFQDTLDAATAAVLGNYHRALAQALPHALADRARLRLHLDSTRARIADLEHDLQHAVMDADEEALAIDRERRDVRGLEQALAAVEARLAAARRDHDRYRPQVDSLLNTPVTPP